MLPLTNILMPELPTSDKSLNNINLLSEEAVVPDASFGDLLVANLVELTEPALPAGDVLPLDGNAMPQELSDLAVESEVLPDLAEAAVTTLAPQLAESEVVAPMPVDDAMPAAPMMPLMPQAAAEPMAPVRDVPEGLMPVGEAQVPRVAPRVEPVSVAEVAQRVDVQLQQQPRSTVPVLEPQLVPQDGRGAADTGAPRIAVPAAMQQALAGDAGGERRDNPGDTAERLPREFLAPRPSADANAPLRTLESAADEGIQNFRSLQQLSQQMQPSQTTQQPGSIVMPSVTPGGVSPAQLTPVTLPPTAEPAITVNTPVTDAAWGEQIGERVVLMANRNLQNVEIRLSPAELGPLRVQVRVDDGAASVTFHATHTVTREALEQALPRLRELFVENGLSLGEANVNEQGMGPQADTGRDAPGQLTAESIEDGEVGGTGAAESAEHVHTRRVIDGLVDTFV